MNFKGQTFDLKTDKVGPINDKNVTIEGRGLRKGYTCLLYSEHFPQMKFVFPSTAAVGLWDRSTE